MEKKKYDIFISHSNVDKDVAFNLCRALEEQGLVCWIAPRNVGAGHYAGSIVEAIENSKILVLVFSSYSNKSTPVLNELEMATSNKLLIIPVRIEETTPTESMKYYIMSNNWFDVFNPQSITDFESFVSTVKSTIVDSNNTITQKFISNTRSKSKTFSFKSFTFIILFFTLVLTMFSFNMISKNTLQAKILEQKDELINQQQRLIEQYLKEQEKNKNNPKVLSQAEHIKEIAGYKEAIKYFRSDNKNLFYANYKNIKLLYFSAHGIHIDNNLSMVGNGSIVNSNNNYKEDVDEKFSLNIKTVPMLSNIKIINSKEKYKNNIYLIKGNYNIQISSNGYKSIEFSINMNRDINLTIELDSISSKKK